MGHHKHHTSDIRSATAVPTLGIPVVEFVTQPPSPLAHTCDSSAMLCSTRAYRPLPAARRVRAAPASVARLRRPPAAAASRPQPTAEVALAEQPQESDVFAIPFLRSFILGVAAGGVCEAAHVALKVGGGGALTRRVAGPAQQPPLRGSPRGRQLPQAR